MKGLITITAYLLLSLTHAFGQERLILENRKTNKKIYISLEREYYFQTAETTYHSKIVGFTDTSLSITALIKTNRDTSYNQFHRRRKAKDTSYAVVKPLYKMDTIKIPFKSIKVLKRDLFKNTQWLLPFGYFLAGAALGVVLLPVAAIEDGKKGVKNWALFEAMLIAISVPPLFIGTRTIKYDLNKKWILEVEK